MMPALVVPIYSRKKFLFRLLTYLSREAWKGEIYLADDSAPDLMAERRAMIQEFKTRLHLVHVVYDVRLELVEKIARALNVVDSPYSLIGSDDDFFILHRLKDAVEFLQAHPDYSVVHGEAVLVGLKSGSAHGEIAWVSPYPQRTIDQISGSQRLMNHLNQYSTTWYSLQRTEQLRKNWQQAAELNLDVYFGELLSSCLSIIQGKAKKLDGLYMVRQGHEDMTSVKEGRRHDVFDWVTDPGWLGQYQRFRDCLAEGLMQQDGIRREQAQKVVKESFWWYLAHQLGEKFDRQRKRQRGTLMLQRLRDAARWVPGLRHTWRMAQAWLPGKRHHLSLPALLRAGSRFHREFTPVYRAMLEQE